MLDTPCPCRCGRSVPFRFATLCSCCKSYFCVRCHQEGCQESHCNTHETCWRAHLPAKADWAEDHKPVGPIARLFVGVVIHSETDDKKLKELHDRDTLARWFNIRRDSGGFKLRVFDRFSQLCDPKGTGNVDTTNQFPSFVSFIGKSGVGKSTLVRAMILLGAINETGLLSDSDTVESDIDAFINILESPRETPVTRSGKLEHLTDPTTFGVHLYGDGRAMSSETTIQSSPVLFADCEGFEAGNAETNSERLTFGAREPERHLLYEEDITSSAYKTQDQRGVELFYARFLYAVSDVVVFVTNEDSTLERAITNIMEWAATAVFNSINHPSKKTLIIVRNMANDYRPELYQESLLNDLYLKQKCPLWEKSIVLKKFVEDYNRRQDKFTKFIYSNEDLYKVLFPYIICYCIPNKKDVNGQPQELFEQYKQLRRKIDDASRRSQALRSKSWTKYNVPTLSRMLLRAFEHFCESDAPFDFYMAARNNNPNPLSSSDHIANFLRLVYNASFELGIMESMIHESIALSFVTWALRNLKQVFDPEVIFDRGEGGNSLEERCEAAFRQYEERYQKCDFKFYGGLTCEIRPASTHMYHQSTNRKRAPGEFVPKRTYTKHWAHEIRKKFICHYRSLVTNDGVVDQPTGKPRACMAKATREKLLQKYHEQWRHIRSNKTCLTCLQAVPENVLPCGHAYCVKCVEELGAESNEYESAWVLDRCSLCWNTQNNPHLVRIKPKCAGVRILTLDGGGIRGVIELALLNEINNTMGLGIPFRDFFDLIIGTSTGGIVALAVGMQDQSISEMTDRFMQFAEDTFRCPNGGDLLINARVGRITTKFFMALGFVKTMFNPNPLKKGLIEFFGEKTSLFSSAMTRHHQCSTKVAVVSATDLGATCCLIASYNRPDLTIAADFEREDDDHLGMKIWEAALATSAAPFYLPPFKKMETGKGYVDGALYANCPAKLALDEMHKLWPKQAVSLDILLSLGTGQQEREIKIPKTIRIGGFAEMCSSFHNNLDTQKIWDRFYKSRATENVRDRLSRLNPHIERDLGYVALWDYQKMYKLKTMIERLVGDPKWKQTIQDIGDKLMANLFFFELGVDGAVTSSTPSVDGTQALKLSTTLRGQIRCRLRHNSVELKRLLDRVDNFYYAKFPEGSSLQPAMLASKVQWTDIKEFQAKKAEIIHNKCRCRVSFEFQVQKGSRSLHLLAVKMKGEDKRIPISGFPVTLEDLITRLNA